MAVVILWLVAIYLLLGGVFGLYFVGRGAERLDPGARAAAWTFKVLILPGAVGLWPILLMRLGRLSTLRAKP